MSHIPLSWDGNGQWYFVTVVTTHGREPVFTDESACRFLKASFHEAHQRDWRGRNPALPVLPSLQKNRTHRAKHTRSLLPRLNSLHPSKISPCASDVLYYIPLSGESCVLVGQCVDIQKD